MKKKKLWFKFWRTYRILKGLYSNTGRKNIEKNIQSCLESKGYQGAALTIYLQKQINFE